MRSIAAFVASGIRTLDDLKEALQLAIELEFATLPPYLCAEWSIKPATDPDGVGRMIHRIVLQEMLHFGLNCNMLSAIGGTPRIADPSFVPTYPITGLPGGVHQGLVVDLAPFDSAAVDTFMQIEYPTGGPIASLAVGPATIGAFYEAVTAAFQSLNPPFIETAPQVTEGLGQDLVAIKSVPDAAAAIKRIVEQGEGTRVSVEEPGFSVDHPAHYYSFAQIAHGHRLVQINGQWRYEGAPIQMPDSFRFSVLDPSSDFDATFSDLLRAMDACWRSGADIWSAIGLMSDLKASGTNLIRTGIRPGFRWTGATARPAAGQPAVNAMPRRV